VHLLRLTAGARSYPTTARALLPPGTTDLDIAYTALSLAVPEKVRFRYRLVGLDTAWQDAGTRREAFYTNLGPGTYRFHVIAANEDGVWNEAGAALDVEIPPTFLQSNVFLALCATTAAGAAWLVFRWRHRRLAAAIRARYDVRLAERTRIAQELHDTLLQGFAGVTAQLYAVRTLLTSRPADAETTLSRALATAHVALRDARRAVWEMRSTELDAGDLPDALAVAGREALSATSSTLQLIVRGDRRPLPPDIEFTAFRIGCEAITNAAKHANARVVALDLSYGRRTLALTVRDDGRGFAPIEVDGARHDGHFGVLGMRERARNVGGTLDIAAAPGGGTRVTVSLPLHD
jgi:signal transduction histidine kinase